MSNEANRLAWVRARIAEVPAGCSLLDVGAGECIYRPDAAHLHYVAQDLAEYDGKGDGRGLQTHNWDTSQIDIKCDLLDIPEDTLYDAVLCSEVLEHVPDPVAALRKVCRLVKPGGRLIVTAPFASITHFAPYHYATGFNRYFYEWHLPRLGFTIERIDPNGSYFEYVEQEMGRSFGKARQYGARPGRVTGRALRWLARIVGRWGEEHPESSDLAVFGWQVVARRTLP